MNSESSENKDPQTKLEELEAECNDLKTELNSAADALGSASGSINGWDYSGSGTIADNIGAMFGALIEAIKERDARIQRLHLKLGQMAEKL